jgi:PRTRC genetic system ThiF family protein
MHNIRARCLTQAVRVAVVGAGGTGSQVVTALASMHHALVALGHPGGFEVTVIDDDIVSPANIGRQMFFPSDVGQFKAEVLVNRVNMTFGTHWKASNCRLCASDTLSHDLVIGCVDTRRARFNILRAMERGVVGHAYWLDFGNRKADGQAHLGEVSRSGRKTNEPTKLPHIGELMPEVIDPDVVDPDEGPSCSLAEALEKQSLFINRALVAHGMAMLWELFRYGKIDHHAVFVNLKTGSARSMPVDPAAWERFGYGARKQHFRLKKAA